MANVQHENGYTKIANAILEQMSLIKLSPIQYRIIFVIWRYTYGFNRKEHIFSLSFLGTATNYDQRQLRRELAKLEQRNIIFQKVQNGKPRIVGFNKDYEQWLDEIEEGKVTSGNSTPGKATPDTSGKVTPGTPGKATPQERNNIKKNKKPRKTKVYDEESVFYKLAFEMFEAIKENNPNHKKPDLQKWANDMRLMIERDSRTEEQIKYLILWTQNDEFEMANILSPSKMRKRFDQLVMKVKRDKNQLNKQKKETVPMEYKSDSVDAGEFLDVDL